jgi:hypothetical protein
VEDYIRIPANQLAVMDCIVRTTGMPTPRYEMEDEIIGPYKHDNQEGFLKYHAGESAWSWINCDEPIPGIAEMPGVQGDSLLELREALYTLSSLTPMELPDDRTKLIMGEAFTYAEWRFAWAFVPELKRWELAPLGRA